MDKFNNALNELHQALMFLGTTILDELNKPVSKMEWVDALLLLSAFMWGFNLGSL